MIEHPILQNWSTLQPGQSVFVVENPSLRYPATVDAITEDRSVIWTTREGIRRAFHQGEGIVITPA